MHHNLRRTQLWLQTWESYSSLSIATCSSALDQAATALLVQLGSHLHQAGSDNHETALKVLQWPSNCGKLLSETDSVLNVIMQ